MKKILIYLIVFVTLTGCASSSLFYKLKTPEKPIIHENQEKKMEFFFDGKKVGEMSVAEFKALLKAGKNYQEMLAIEKRGDVKVVLKDDIWKIEPGKEFKTKMEIVWFDGKDEFKKVEIEVKVKIKKEGGFSEIRILYRDIAEVGFPVSTGLLILLIFLLVLL